MSASNVLENERSIVRFGCLAVGRRAVPDSSEDALLQDLFTGISVGLVYGVVGAGFVVIHRITGMVNFAQGDLAMIGAFGAVVAFGALPVGLAIASGTVVGGLAGLLLYLLVVLPLRKHELLVQTIATLGAAIVLRAVAQLVFGSKPYTLPPLTAGDSFTIAGATLPRQTLWLVGFAVLLFIGLTLFFDHTMTGRAMGACAINPYAAGVVGISVPAMAAVAFALSGAMTGLFGAAQVSLSFATVDMGLLLGLKGFIAAILGGFNKIGLAMIGGVLVGVFESWVGSTLSGSYQDVIVFALLVVLLVARPSGLTRLRVTERV